MVSVISEKILVRIMFLKNTLDLILKNNINFSTCSKSKRNRQNENIDLIFVYKMYLVETNPNSSGEEFDDFNFIYA